VSQLNYLSPPLSYLDYTSYNGADDGSEDEAAVEPDNGAAVGLDD
jgi:hypothetical protein